MQIYKDSFFCQFSQGNLIGFFKFYRLTPSALLTALAPTVGQELWMA